MRLATAAWLALLIVAMSAASAHAAQVSLPASVSVGERVAFSGSGFAPGEVLDVVVAPRENRGGSCCGRGLTVRPRADRAGRVRSVLVWPATYFFSGGIGSTRAVRWKDGEQADVTLSSRRSFARDVVVVRDRAATGGGTPAPGAGATVAWTAPPFSGKLVAAGGPRLPVQLAVNAAVTGSGVLAAGAQPTFVASPIKVYSFKGPQGGSVSFSLQAATWTPREGVTGPQTTIAPALSWPQLTGTTAELPLASATSTVTLNRPVAQVTLRVQLDAGASTDVGRVAGWVLSRGWLSPPAQVTAVAFEIARELKPVLEAYQVVLDAQQLQANVQRILTEAVPLAREAGVIVSGVVRVIAAPARRAAQVIQTVTRPVRALGNLIATVAVAPASPAALGTRAPLRAAPASLRRLRRLGVAAAAPSRAVKATLTPYTGPFRVTRLLLDRRVARPAGKLTVAARGLSATQVVATVLGPAATTAERPLNTRSGTAATVITMPRRRGRYTVAIADFSGPVANVAAAIVVVR